VQAAADSIARARARLLLEGVTPPDTGSSLPPTGLGLPENVLLAEWYAASTAPDSAEAANAEDGMPPIDPARLSPATVLATARAVGDSAIEARTRCALCPKKVFKAPYFAVKHLLNKHPEGAIDVLGNAVAMLHAAVNLRLAEAAYMRRAYFSDPRRPTAWHEPSELRSLLIDTASAAQRIINGGVNLALALAALADGKGRAGAGIMSTALGLTGGAGAGAGAHAMLSQVLGVAMVGGIGPLLPMGQMPGGMLGAALGGSRGGALPAFAMGRGGYTGRGTGRGVARGGRLNQGPSGLLGAGPTPAGFHAEGEGGEEGSNRGGRRGGMVSTYRDRDAVRPAGLKDTPNYGAAVVSYDDI